MNQRGARAGVSQSLRKGVPGKMGKPQKGCSREGGKASQRDGPRGGEPQKGTSSQSTRPERRYTADT